jgi:hypothetical protein
MCKAAQGRLIRYELDCRLNAAAAAACGRNQFMRVGECLHT